ncbi:Hypothetical predicted protein [Lecanosticta acicola]|uniref:Metallo-beta-lactamase domain-containing protein n=1 Tax=Lecanosticta acicola TaxID=111012 RepID=A0AAI8YSA2_9PEZI|nr:Hypothetical predicted protein [Lecanosticta acicola]
MATATLEWFGATTYRLRSNGLTIFLDAWLDRPDCLPQYLDIDSIHEADYVFISHAHFDHLPGADRIALQTGATVIGNGEAIHLLRQAGVPDEQLLPVAGGERIPLYTRSTLEKARRGELPTTDDRPPGAPVLPHPSLAAAAVHVWPVLHCLMPGASHADIPEVMDTGKVYCGSAPYACTLDVTFGMKYGLLRIGEHVPREQMDAGMRSFAAYVHRAAVKNCMFHFDGGQLLYNFLLGERHVLCWNAHLGGYRGILEALEPRPDVLIQAIAGRANLNGRPFEGSAAEFAVCVSDWLGDPAQVIWCLHDEAPIKPWTVDVQPATKLVEDKTRSRVRRLEPAVENELSWRV